MDLVFSNSNTRSWLWINAFKIWKNDFFTKNSLPSQTCSRDHWKQKLPKRKTVGRKEFPGRHYIVDVEDKPDQKMMSQEIDMLRVVTTKIPAGSVSSFYQRAECLDEPRFLSVHTCLDHVLMKSWCSYLRSHTCFILSTFTSSLNVFCFALHLRAGGGSRWS